MGLYFEICGFLNRHPHLRRATFGRLAAKDPRLVFDLAQGRQPRPSTIYKIRAFMAEQDQKVAEEIRQSIAA
jgi:hypothetical protein